jgi:hypothetical protein
MSLILLSIDIHLHRDFQTFPRLEYTALICKIVLQKHGIPGIENKKNHLRLNHCIQKSSYIPQNKKVIMKTNILLRVTLIIACVGVLVACNKNSANTPASSPTSTANVQTQADDESQVSNESDLLVNDANTALNSQTSIAGNSVNASSQSGSVTTMGVDPAGPGVLGNLICDASVVVNDTSNPRTITITYNGTNCWGNRTRTGVVVISIPAGIHWRDKGASVTISIENLTITRLRDGKTIVINGTKTITNVSGGLLVDLATLGSITHTITGSLTVGFQNGTQRDWNISKQRVFTYDDGIVITTTGTHSDSLGNNNVAEWGTTRFGLGFESLITQAKVIRQDCDFRLVSGQNEVLLSNGATLMITYGLDAEGNPTSCPGTGTYYFEVVWTNGGVTITKILPY